MYAMVPTFEMVHRRCFFCGIPDHVTGKPLQPSLLLSVEGQSGKLTFLGDLHVAGMPITNETWLPSYEELTVPELNLSTPALRAGAAYFGKYCDFQSKEFMLCISEEKDPRKCLNEGKEVTRCGIEFFKKVRGTCMEEFTAFSRCIDRDSEMCDFRNCKKTQKVYDTCMSERFGMERPPLGYFAKVRLHESKRPKPAPHVPDVQEETPGPPDQETMASMPAPPSVKLGSRVW